MTTMHIDPGEVEYYAERRMENAAVALGINRLMFRVGLMPSSAWGRMAWSQAWAEDWVTACGRREQDAASVHDFTLETGNRMLQAVADYTHTDVQASASFTVDTPGLDVYMRPVDTTDRQVGTYRPGGGYAYSDAARSPFYGGNPALDQGPGNPELVGIYADSCPADAADSLSQFLSTYRDFLSEVYDKLTSYGLHPVNLLEDYLDPAASSSPFTIDQFSEEILKGANGWSEMVDAVKHDNANLLAPWTGAGGQAAQGRGQDLAAYLEYCVKETTWLGNAGKQSAVTIRNIRNGFAQAGFARIQSIISEFQAFNSWFSSASSFVFHLSGGNLADAGGNLVKLFGDYASALEGVIADQAKTESAIASVEVTANGMPDLATIGHDHHPPYRGEGPGADAWARPGAWR
jgi:hypothetical protein